MAVMAATQSGREISACVATWWEDCAPYMKAIGARFAINGHRSRVFVSREMVVGKEIGATRFRSAVAVVLSAEEIRCTFLILDQHDLVSFVRRSMLHHRMV